VPAARLLASRRLEPSAFYSIQAKLVIVKAPLRAIRFKRTYAQYSMREEQMQEVFFRASYLLPALLA